MDIDFPPSPAFNQQYTAPSGVVYQWNGFAWTVVTFVSPTMQFKTVGDILYQVRILLQDTDISSGQYRYSTDSVVLAVNQGMMDMFRIRPDLFMTQGFVIPIFSLADLTALLGIEPQYVPPLVYYVVGLVQARDDEQNQDARAMGFLKVFQQTIVNGGIA